MGGGRTAAGRSVENYSGSGVPPEGAVSGLFAVAGELGREARALQEQIARFRLG
jgi:hypothetical protein